MEKYKQGVLIIMPVYNHSKFVRTAINSVLIQKTIAPNKLYISDDNSLDDTFEICTSYTSTNKLCIVVNREPENIGASNNGKKIRRYALQSGWKYVAILEGDDYWSDSEFLQKQVDFLEKNPNYTFTCTNIHSIDEFGNLIPNTWPNKSTSFTINKRAIGTNLPIPTCSLVFKSSALDADSFTENAISNAVLPDYFFKNLLLTKGKGFFFFQKMATYRYHNNGIFSSLRPNSRYLQLAKTRASFFHYCLKKKLWISAIICLKNIILHPKF